MSLTGFSAFGYEASQTGTVDTIGVTNEIAGGIRELVQNVLKGFSGASEVPIGVQNSLLKPNEPIQNSTAVSIDRIFDPDDISATQITTALKAAISLTVNLIMIAISVLVEVLKGLLMALNQS